MTELEPDTPITPVDSWAEVDPDWVPFADPDLGVLEESAAEDLSEEELAQEPEEGDVLEGPRWVRFELWAQNLSDGTERYLASTADFDGPLEVEIGNLPPGDLMRFWVRLIDSNGRHSNMSDPIDLRLPVDLTPPGRPTPPTVAEAFGLVAIHHDCELEDGEKPDDFSHIVLYAQQMHPPGNPSGPPGGARAITRITQESSTVVGDFFSGIPHRVFAVAVDTTGNESARSEYVEVTPKLPFDDTELQETLRELNEEILPKLAEDQELLEQAMEQLNGIDLPGLQEQLENGLAEVNQNLIPLQQLSEQNQSRLDTLNNETLPGVQATLTGVESALTTAQGQINTLNQTTIPGINSAISTAQGQLNTLNNTTLPNLNQALTTGLSEANQWREVGAISASSVRVGNWENLLPEDYIWELREKGLDGTPIWEETTGGAAGWTTIINQLGMPVLIRFNASQHNGVTSRLAFMGPSGKGLRVRSGEEFSLTGTGWVSSGASDELLLQIRYATEDGSYVSRDTAGQFPNGSFSHTWKVPDNATIQRMQIEFTASSAASGNAHMGDIRLRTRITSNLIVDGAVIADKIATNAVESDKIVANAITTAKIAANAITANELAANSVQAGHITANAVTTAKIATNAVTANEIAANTIVAGNIATNAIQARHLQANSVGADQIIANSIGTDHLQARSVQAHQLQVGSFDNLFSDQQFTSYRDFSTGTNSPWVRVSGNPHNVWRWENNPDLGASIVNTVSGAVSRMELYCGEVAPGDQMSFRIRVRKTSNADGFRIHARHRGENRSSPLATTTLLGSSFSDLPTDSVREINWTVPSNSGIRELWIDFETVSTSAGNARFSEPYMRRRIESQLLVDGAVITDKLAANAVVADKIATNAIQTRHITAGSVSTNELAANAVNADKIAANAITSAKIAANAVGANEIAANAVTASQIRAGAIDGMLITGAVIRGGEIYAGANSEGALIPDEGRLRIQGRMPRASASARDTFTTGTTAAMRFTSSNWVDNGTAVRIAYTITYPAPAPSGNRYPLVGLHGDTPNMEGPATATSRAQNPGQFQVIVRSAGPSGTHGDVRIRYFAIWADTNA